MSQKTETQNADRISVATQWQLMWWRFRKHRAAIVAAIVLLLFYVVVLFADFLAYSDPAQDNAEILLLSPQSVHLWDGDEFKPHVYGFTGKRDPKTFKKVYTVDPEKKIPVVLFAEGYEYKLLGLFSILADHDSDPSLHDHRLGGRGPEPLSGYFIGRTVRALWRPCGQYHSANH